MEDIKNKINKIADVYKSLTIEDNVVPAVIKMVFSKYIVDKYLFAENKEEMMYYADAQKAIISGDAFLYINMLQPIYDMIDTKIHSNNILNNVPHLMTNEIFSNYNKKKSYSSEEASKYLMRVISELDCSTIDDTLLFDELLAFIYSSSEKYGRRSLETTSKSINLLASNILDVGSEDIFKDFACGYGLSTFEIIKNDINKMYLSDIHEEKVQIAIMLSIIKHLSMDKCYFEVSNMLDNNNVDQLATKIFLDFPLSIRIDKEKYGSSNGNILAIKKVLENLSNNGVAIVTCASGMLFSESKELLDFRKSLIENNFVEAIITLPPVMYGTMVNVNLIVLSKKDNKDICLVDASDNKFFQFSNNARSNKTELTNEGIQKIIDIIKNKETIVGISKVASNVELITDKTFVPTYYIEIPKSEISMSYKEINDKLEELYKRLR